MNTSEAKKSVDLKGVPETMLMPLWNRGSEQKRADKLIDDPLSLQLMESIDYDFKASFGKPNPGHPIRARVFDDAIKEWLKTHPEGTIVALGEGLESQFWRVDNGKMKWVSVDLEESIEVRQRLLPQEDRMRLIACSALDYQWMNEVPQHEPLFFTMAGLLMYFKPDEVRDLLKTIAERFPGSEVCFDFIPRWMSNRSMKELKVTKAYTIPQMPWGINFKDDHEITDAHPRYKIINKWTYAEPYPNRMRFYYYLSYIKWVKNNIAPGLIHLKIENDSTK